MNWQITYRLRGERNNHRCSIFTVIHIHFFFRRVDGLGWALKYIQNQDSQTDNQDQDSQTGQSHSENILKVSSAVSSDLTENTANTTVTCSSKNPEILTFSENSCEFSNADANSSSLSRNYDEIVHRESCHSISKDDAPCDDLEKECSPSPSNDDKIVNTESCHHNISKSYDSCDDPAEECSPAPSNDVPSDSLEERKWTYTSFATEAVKNFVKRSSSFFIRLLFPLVSGNYVFCSFFFHIPVTFIGNMTSRLNYLCILMSLYMHY